MSDVFRTLSVVGVDYNVRPVVENEIEMWRASCSEFDALHDQVPVGTIVLAVTAAEEEGFVARVVEPPVARGKRLDARTGQPAQVYRLIVTPVDISALVITRSEASATLPE